MRATGVDLMVFFGGGGGCSLLPACNGGISVILYRYIYLRTCHISFSFPMGATETEAMCNTVLESGEFFHGKIISSRGSTRRYNSFLNV